MLASKFQAPMAKWCLLSGNSRLDQVLGLNKATIFMQPDICWWEWQKATIWQLVLNQRFLAIWMDPDATPTFLQKQWEKERVAWNILKIWWNNSKIPIWCIWSFMAKTTTRDWRVFMRHRQLTSLLMVLVAEQHLFVSLLKPLKIKVRATSKIEDLHQISILTLSAAWSSIRRVCRALNQKNMVMHYRAWRESVPRLNITKPWEKGLPRSHNHFKDKH